MEDGAFESGFHSSEKPDNSSASGTEKWLPCEISDTDSLPITRDKLQAACRNIEFLKREHTITIHELHKEIERLHNFIRDIQFKQHVLEVIIPDNDFFNCDIATLEQKVDSLIVDNKEVKKRLQESNKALEKLDQKQSMERWQTQQQLQDKENTILRLEKELEAKCSAIADLKSQLARKKSGFLRRFSFNSDSASNVRALFGAKCYNAHDLPEDSSSSPKAASLPAKSSPSHSLNYDYSSFSSLSDRSNSDEEFLRTPLLRKQYTFPSPKRGLRHSWQHRSVSGDNTSFKLPPITGITQPSRRLVRQQIRVDKLATKTMLDSVAIDHVSLPELADKI